jgi:hypothetical protein
MISSAVLAEVNGRQLVFQLSNRVMAPRRMAWRVLMPKKIGGHTRAGDR